MNSEFGIRNSELPPTRPWNCRGHGHLKTRNSNLKTAAAIAVVSMVLASACAHRGTPSVQAPPARPAAAAPEGAVSPDAPLPTAAVELGWSERGIASWYGEPYHGRRTASGEVYDMHALTAAHPSLPFGTVVEVRRRDSGAEVTVRVNDRGPFIAGRVIDLSYAAAARIGLEVDGIAEVALRVVGREDPPPRAAAPPPGPLAAETCFWVQVGAFGEIANARRAQAALAGAGEHAVVLEGLDALARVRLGPFTDADAAERARGRIAADWPGAYVVACGG
jgi:rare lipoprotein A